MNTEALPSRQQRLREAAILVASLDDQLAERLVASMPTADAAAVRSTLKQLGAIDPDERDEIVAKFRQSTAAPAQNRLEGVELDASLLARIEKQDVEGQESYRPDSERVVVREPFNTLSPEEATTVVSMLSAEHPQTISIVLSRLDPSTAANLLAKFPATIQAEVLTRMANCDSADEQSVRVIESQLGQWIDQHRQQRRRMAAGLDLVQQILLSTPETQRKTVLTQLRGSDPDLVGRLTEKPQQTFEMLENNPPRDESGTVPLLAREHSAVPAKAMPRARDVSSVAGVEKIDLRYQQPSPVENASSPSRKPLSATDTQQKLDQLDGATLMAALSQADRQVVTLALAGASEALMQRVLQGLPRRQAAKLRSQLRGIGPTRLSDMLAAQQQLLHSAYELTN